MPSEIWTGQGLLPHRPTSWRGLHLYVFFSRFINCLGASVSIASREKTYKQIGAAVAKFREIKDNINEGLKFYITLQVPTPSLASSLPLTPTLRGAVPEHAKNRFFPLQDAIMNVKQQGNDFVMTRSLQCTEMVESMQKKMASLSFSEGKPAGYGYQSTGPSNPPANAYCLPPEPLSHPRPSAYTQPYPPPEQHQQQPRPGAYSHPYPPYVAPPPTPPQQQQLHPYHAAPMGVGPYQVAQPQPQPQPARGDYGQPAYPGWRGPYYNAAPQQQQPAAPQQPRPPYTLPGPYAPQGGYYGRPHQ